MEIKTIAEQFAQLPIESIVLENGKEIKAKRISRSTIATMEKVLPGIKSAAYAIPYYTNAIAHIGEKPLFEPVGDWTSYIQKDNGAFLSAQKGSYGKIVSQPGFFKTEYNQEGTKIASKITDAMPFVYASIALIEIGINLYKQKEAIEIEKTRFYTEHYEKLSDYYEDLCNALDDYTKLGLDNVITAGHASQINAAFNYAKSIFSKLKQKASDIKKAEERDFVIMKMSLVVYSFAYLLKIIFSKTECKEYIKNALRDINDFNNALSILINKKYDYEIESITDKLAKHQKVEKFADVLASPSSSIPTTTNTFGSVFQFLVKGGGLVYEMVSEKNQEKLVRQRDELKAEKQKLLLCQNPYAVCIESISQYVSDQNIILIDNDSVYYEIPEACSEQA